MMLVPNELARRVARVIDCTGFRCVRSEMFMAPPAFERTGAPSGAQ